MNNFLGESDELVGDIYEVLSQSRLPNNLLVLVNLGSTEPQNSAPHRN